MNPPFYRRYIIITIICTILATAVVIQMIRINYTSYAKDLIAVSANYQGIQTTIIPPRGTIYDRSGHILATNKIGYEVAIDLKFVSDPESIASAVADHINTVDYATAFEIANKEKLESDENRYFVIASYVSEEKITALEELKETYKAKRIETNSAFPNLNGLAWTPMQQRAYPEGSLGANVLGFYNYFSRESAQGVHGVEEAYNHLLTGLPQKVFLPNDPNLVETLPEIEPGSDLVLTIDREIQMMLEETLTEAIEWSGAENGTIIVADPETGEILGIASTPSFDPNHYEEYLNTFPGNTPFNRAIGTTYEPGSVFKVITMGAVFDSGLAEPNTIYNDASGVFWVDGLPIYNWDGGAWGEQTMLGCMQHSLNVCLAHVAVDLLGQDLFYDYLQAFGFGRSTGIDLSGEANFPLRLPSDNQWVKLDLATNSFGQGIAVTPIQMVMAISAIANDGKMMTPHVVKSVVNGEEPIPYTPQVISSPVSDETAHTLTEMLTISLEEEASSALVEGYRIAGKTGTGEIPTEFGYTTNQTNASFVGWGPSDDPKFIVYIWLEKPTISQWGSEVAAPVFHDVVEQLVVLMRIPPDNVRLGSNQ